MSAQGKRDAAVVFVPLGACRRQKIVQRVRSTLIEYRTVCVGVGGVCVWLSVDVWLCAYVCVRVYVHV